MTRSSRWLVSVVVVLACFGAAAIAFAQLVTFAPGQPALAAEVNANFAYLNARIVPPGTVLPWAGAGALPAGWLECNGSAFSAATYPELAAVLGTTYGGTASNPLLPDCRGRVAVGRDSTSLRIGSGQAATIGNTGGVHANTAVPAHSHTIGNGAHDHRIRASCNNSSCGSGTDGFTRGSSNLDSSAFGVITDGSHDHGGATGTTGSPSVTNLQPFITFRYIIKT